MSTRVALSIAGSDSGGGAGIQADLKAFARCGVHGTCAITAVTAQDTVAVRAVHPLAPELVLAQARAVIADIGVDAVKVGMLGDAAVARAVVRLLDELRQGTPIVVDPVLAASSGASLLDADAYAVLTGEILPRATVITPNLPEGRLLLGRGEWPQADAAQEHADAHALLRELAHLGASAVVLTGGHRPSTTDLFLEGAEGEIVEIPGERQPAGAEHGSGCTHSAVLAAELALGATPLEAARRARKLTGLAIAHGLRDVGGGSGPVDVLGDIPAPDRARD